MYNPLLNTFICVVDNKSFTKASEILFISPAGVMKQINTLESQLGIRLLNRNTNGVTLTSAGAIIYQNAKEIIKLSNLAIEKAKEKENEAEKTFCVGTSFLNPAMPFMNLWYKLSDNFRDYKLHLVPFEDNNTGILSEIKQLGIKFDFLIGVCDSKTWLSLCNFLELGTYKKMIAVSRKHRLAKKKIIRIEDLYGETLMMVKRGDSKINDIIRDDIEKNHPQIKIEDTPPFYDLSIFNRASETKNVLLTIECWKDVHPDLISIPVEWDYTIPYGLLYSKNAPDDVVKFVEIAKKTVKNKKKMN